jgi:hypothetical protein
MFAPGRSRCLSFFLSLPLAAALGQEAPRPDLPDVQQLMREVADHQKKVEQLRENYTYTALFTLEEVSPKGGVTRSKIDEASNFYVNGYLISRSIMEDSTPLSGQRLQEEDKRVAKMIKKCEKLPHREPNFEALGIAVSRLLEIVDASNVRLNESFHGRPAILVDFVGRKDAKTRGPDEKLVKYLRGTIWIDEADREMAHLEVIFDEDFHVGWGMVGTIRKGSKLEVDQAPVTDGLWLPTRYDSTMQGKILVAANFLVHASELDSDFKRFDVETLQSKDAAIPPKKQP